MLIVGGVVKSSQVCYSTGHAGSWEKPLGGKICVLFITLYNLISQITVFYWHIAVAGSLNAFVC